MKSLAISVILRSTWFRKVIDGAGTYKLLNDSGDSWKSRRKMIFNSLIFLNLFYGEL